MTTLSIQKSHFNNLTFSHFGECLSFASSVKLRVVFQSLLSLWQMFNISLAVRFASFGNHIGDIFFLSSKKKMRRINAGGNVATVQDKHSFRNITVKPFVRMAMRFNLLAVELKKAVTVVRNAACPQPTAIGFGRFLNFRKETQTGVFKGLGYNRVGHLFSPVRKYLARLEFGVDSTISSRFYYTTPALITTTE